jgi:hypothetical protein
MLDQLTFDQMKQCVGQNFRVEVDGREPVDLLLVRAGKVMESEAARLPRAPFSLFFLGPHEAFLPQKIYQFQHETFGPEPEGIFLVPVGKDPKGFLYEAVFT